MEYYKDAFGFYRSKKKEPRYMGQQPKGDNIAGYCTNKLHKGKMSVKMIKQHDCLNKQCPYFRKNTKHPKFAKKEVNE